ncbi:hypothetical protein EVAR_53093_1 [Eumeta japonica]|uniref:Uncharacterized protein n=1 Tax=Eumeta variegata TaxID=151549 RepID=A0A4C1ZIC7_EUMVA|nr:hypothetical protein EVAR_53093_1 [Eumeta japonica]
MEIDVKRVHPSSMEECKKRLQAGTKVSKIANIFQGMPSREDEELRGPEVTVVRTESHLARFNTARALFEKLGEENRGFHRIEKSPSAAASFAGTRSACPPSRSRSSSAGSVSPPRRSTAPSPISVATLNGDRIANGSAPPPAKPVKPVVLPKPEKPDRRFNKELIEKQKNWTSHFTKPRVSRHDQEPRLESKYPSGVSDRKSPEVSERTVIPSRVYSPPLSPCATDTHFVERPSTLPTIANRNVSGAKIASPIKNVHPTSPLSKSSNFISPTVKSTVIFSENKKSDSSTPSPVTQTVKNESVNTPSGVNTKASKNAILDNTLKSEIISPNHVKPQLSSSPSRENSPVSSNELPSKRRIDEVDLSVSVPKSTDRTSPTVSTPTSNSNTVTVPVIPARSQSTSSIRSLVSPTTRLPTSPVAQLPQDEKTKRSLRTDNDSESPTSSEEQVSSMPVVKPRTVDSIFDETVQQVEEWEKKCKRRSSTPDSPALAEDGEPERSPLVSPVASPVPCPALATSVDTSHSPDAPAPPPRRTPSRRQLPRRRRPPDSRSRRLFD